ncbi:RING/U-box [Violaceomyces palustris]|uniref:RING/U-box n=1 Tax=Violaceomyces palustris TaxID=1673888 RepID=A0ACD0NQR7_9BASI|nr:RING/U-box [Violaceomyces palustris]
MKVKLKSFTPVAYWHWDTRDPDDVCGICQNQFDGVCGTCKEPGDGCPLLFGKCTHEFHLHCIMQWLEQHSRKPLCPLCKRPWEEATAEKYQEETAAQQ